VTLKAATDGPPLLKHSANSTNTGSTIPNRKYLKGRPVKTASSTLMTDAKSQSDLKSYNNALSKQLVRPGTVNVTTKERSKEMARKYTYKQETERPWTTAKMTFQSLVSVKS